MEVINSLHRLRGRLGFLPAVVIWSWVWFGLGAAWAQPLAAQVGKPGPVSYAEIRHQIIAREKASFDAWSRKDKAFYQDYWADDMTEFLPESRHLATKAEVMPTFDKIVNRWRLEEIQMHDPRIQVYGKVAILTYTESVTGRYDGKLSHYEGKVTMVYVREGGEWKGVHYHESVIDN
jgi:ketosteroid isomerase-like protein